MRVSIYFHFLKYVPEIAVHHEMVCLATFVKFGKNKVRRSMWPSPESRVPKRGLNKPNMILKIQIMMIAFSESSYPPGCLFDKIPN